MSEDISDLKKSIETLTHRMVAQGYVLEQLAVSMFRSSNMTKAQFDVQSKIIRNNFGVTDVTHPGAIRAAATAEATRVHLDQIFEALRRQLPD